MEEIRIPNDATYSPVALTDVMLTAPLVSRLLLGATLPGRVLQLAALGVYAASALQDWLERQGVRKVEFLAEFGADLDHLDPMPTSVREEEVWTLVDRLNTGYRAERPSRQALAVSVDRHLTAYIASITGQRVETSTEVRNHTLVRYLFPFALGAADILSGDVAIFQDTGVLEPHVLSHEFCHRKGYWKELEAQVLSYLALSSSGDPILLQASLFERLHRGVRVLAGDDHDEFRDRVERLGLRAELRDQLLGLRPAPSAWTAPIEQAMKRLYEERMRLTGQNGLSDYDRGFTDFLYTFERSGIARQSPPAAGAIHRTVGRA